MILVVGGLGFIGSHTTRALLDLGHECVVVQRSAGHGGSPQVERADVTDLEALRDIGRRHHITGIIHLAGAGLGADPIADQRTGTQALLNVLQVAAEWQVPRVGIASTIGVYDGGGDSPLREDAPLPLTAGHAIPAAKKVAEVLGGYLGSATGIEVYSLRIGAVWGPGGRPTSRFFAAPQLVHAAARGETTQPVFAEGGIDMIYVKDCGRAIAMLQTASRLRHRVYNVASGRATANAELVDAIKAVVPDARIEVRAGRDPRGLGSDVYLDVTRARADGGFEPGYDTRAAAADYIGWLRAGNDR